MIVLSNGYKLPETGDFGSVWFPALEDNIQYLNDHIHDGTDSNKIPSSSVEGEVTSILVGAFTPSGSEFVATYTNVSVDFDNKHIIIRDPTTKEPIYMRYTKASATQLNIYTNIVQAIEVVLI